MARLKLLPELFFRNNCFKARERLHPLKLERDFWNQRIVLELEKLNNPKNSFE